MQPPATPPPAPPPPAPAPRRRGSAKLVAGVLLLLVLAFLAGYVPERMAADRMETTLRTAQLDLELANLHRDLGVAALEAQRNNFTTAATAAQTFFEGCARLAQRNSFENEPRTQIALAGYAQQRDTVMVQLAQANPAVAQRLADLYFTMQGVLERRK
jgi:hypothetical protein